MGENIQSKSKNNVANIIEFMIYTTTQFNIFLERKHELHLLFTLYKKS